MRNPLLAASGSAHTHDDELLIDIANKCITTADELQTTLKKLKGDSKGGFRDAFKKTVRAISKRKEIEQKKMELDAYQKTLDTHILARLDANSSESSQRYAQVLQRLNDLGVAIENTTARDTQAVSNHVQSAQVTALMESLRFAEIYARHEQIADAHKKTFEWIFRMPKNSDEKNVPKWASFTAWLEGEDVSSIYWIHGKAGSGKSTLMSYMVEDERTREALRAWCGDATVLTPAFFFWSSGSPLQKNVQGLLRSLLYQLLEGSEELKAELAMFQLGLKTLQGDKAWTERRLLSMLNKILDACGSKNL